MIPKLHYISQGSSPDKHLENIRKACESGAKLVQLRLKNLDETILLKTAEKAREITNTYQTRLIINDHYKIAKSVNADGVHLGKTDAHLEKARAHLYDWQIIGGTANTLADCQMLIDKNVDYIGLGPFRFTPTKANLSPILGLEGYSSILQVLQTQTPIIAIGGITLHDVSMLLKAGIYGIAASGALTSDFHKIELFNKLLQPDVLT